MTVLDPPPAGLGDDVATRLHALQLLAALAGHAAPRLVAAVLASPGGVARVMDALGDGHDAVRAEAQALLVSLACASPDVQKIAAFDGAFERLLGTVRASGGVGGGVAVQDALDLVAALVGGNAVTVTLFREGGGVVALVPLLACQPGRKPPPQTAANVGAALAVVGACVARPAPTAPADAATARTACQDALLQQGAMPALLNMCLENGGVQDDGVRVKVSVGKGRLCAPVSSTLPFFSPPPPTHANTGHAHACQADRWPCRCPDGAGTRQHHGGGAASARRAGLAAHRAARTDAARARRRRRGAAQPVLPQRQRADGAAGYGDARAAW